ncbi:hypothetical protein [Methylobacterium sp. CM6257]
MDDRNVARGLAWFGIGLGLAETFAPRRVAEATGLEGHERTIQLYGLREIASGVAILAADEHERHLGLRVAGDLLDGGLLAARAIPSNPRRGRTLAAALAVAPVIILDTAYWLKARDRRQRIPRSPADLCYVRYRADVETIAPDEDTVIDQILASQQRLHGRNLETFGRPVRASHGRMHGAAVGELEVLPNLPPWLRQGLFAEPGRYPVVARLANVPGEVAPDAVATQRGFSFEVIGVPGMMLPEHAGELTQDFVLDSGPRFAAGTARQSWPNRSRWSTARRSRTASRRRSRRSRGPETRRSTPSAPAAPCSTSSDTPGCIPWRRPISRRRPSASATPSPSSPSSRSVPPRGCSRTRRSTRPATRTPCARPRWAICGTTTRNSTCAYSSAPT